MDEQQEYKLGTCYTGGEPIRKCPICGSTNFHLMYEYDDPNETKFDKEQYIQFHCSDCGGEWVNEYRYVGVTVTKKHGKEW